MSDIYDVDRRSKRQGRIKACWGPKPDYNLGPSLEDFPSQAKLTREGGAIFSLEVKTHDPGEGGRGQCSPNTDIQYDNV